MSKLEPHHILYEPGPVIKTSPDQLRQLMHAEYENNGRLAPQTMSWTGRVPFDPMRPPTAMYVPGRDTMDHLYDGGLHRYALNATNHQQMLRTQDWFEQRINTPWKFGGPIVSTFTPYIVSADGRYRGMLVPSFLPRNATDEDGLRAMELSYHVQPDTSLAADATYWTAPGQEFRHV